MELRSVATKESLKQCEPLFEKGIDVSYFQASKGACIVQVPLPLGDKRVVSITSNTPDETLYTKDTLASSPYGALTVYTWILYKKGGDLEFAATRVNDLTETGTLHVGLARTAGAKTIHAAGELLHGPGKDEFSFNLLSGSYAAKLLQQAVTQGCRASDPTRMMEKKVVEFLAPLNVRPGLVSAITPETFKNVKYADLRAYADKGYNVCLYPVDKADVCKSEARMKTCRSGRKMLTTEQEKRSMVPSQTRRGGVDLEEIRARRRSLNIKSPQEFRSMGTREMPTPSALFQSEVDTGPLTPSEAKRELEKKGYSFSRGGKTLRRRRNHLVRHLKVKNRTKKRR